MVNQLTNPKHFFYKMVHFEKWDFWIVGFVQHVSYAYAVRFLLCFDAGQVTHIRVRAYSVAMGYSYGCPSASEVTLNDMDEYVI